MNFPDLCIAAATPRLRSQDNANDAMVFRVMLFAFLARSGRHHVCRDFIHFHQHAHALVGRERQSFAFAKAESNCCPGHAIIHHRQIRQHPVHVVTPLLFFCRSPAMMRNGLLDRRDSLDLLQDLDFGIMDLGMSDSEIPDLPEEDVNSVINDANVNHNISNDRDHCSDKFCDGNDTIEIVRRKDSGGGGGDFGQSGGGVKGAGGDGVSTAGGGTSAGGGKAAASSVSQPGARGECGGFEGLRRGRSSSRKGAALNSIENHDSGGRRSFGGLQTADAASGTAASTAPGKRGGVIASSCYSEQDIDVRTLSSCSRMALISWGGVVGDCSFQC